MSFDISPSGTITDRNYITSIQPSIAKFIPKKERNKEYRNYISLQDIQPVNDYLNVVVYYQK